MAEYLEFIIIILSSSTFTAAGSAWWNRRKNKIDIEEKINEMAGKLIDDQREQIDRLKSQISVLEAEYREVKAENEFLKTELAKLNRRYGNVGGGGSTEQPSSRGFSQW